MGGLQKFAQFRPGFQALRGREVLAGLLDAQRGLGQSLQTQARGGTFDRMRKALQLSLIHI